MKKTLIALAALAASSVAMAQSSVTLFGVVDLGVSQMKDTDSLGGGSVLGSAAPSTKRTGLKSVLSGSRFGMRGAEDLGGGLKADFMLEYSVQPDEFLTSMNNRQSWVGLGGGFGAVKLGRQYTPFHNVQAAIDVAGNADAPGYVLALHNRARASNAIRYDMPSMGGFNAAVMVGFGEASRNSNASPNPDTDNSWGLNATYTSGPLLVGFAYDEVKRPSTFYTRFNGFAGDANTAAIGTNVLFGDGLLRGNSDKVATWALGGAYDFGVARVTAGYSVLKDTGATAADGNLESKGWLLGVSVPMGATTLYAGYGAAKVNESTAPNQDLKYRGYQLGANYALSKRTTAYALYGADRVKVDGVAGSAKRSQVSVGLRHTF